MMMLLLLLYLIECYGVIDVVKLCYDGVIDLHARYNRTHQVRGYHG